MRSSCRWDSADPEGEGFARGTEGWGEGSTLAAVENESALADIKRDVGKLCDRFPPYATRLEPDDRSLARV